MPIVTPRTDTVEIVPVLGRRHRLRWWVATAALALALLTPLFFAVAALGTRVGLWSVRFGFGTLARGVGPNLPWLTLAVGLAAVLLGAFLRPRCKRATLAGAFALVVALVGLGWGVGVKARAERLPFIHDISTDTQDPPTFSDAVVRLRGSDANTLDYTGKRDARENRLVSVLQTRDYPEIRPLVSERAPEDALNRARDVARRLGWDVVAVDPDAGVLEATERTRWFGFRDDVVVRVRPGAGGGSVVDVRSVSRVGASDLGANAARIRRFLEAFEG